MCPKCSFCDYSYDESAAKEANVHKIGKSYVCNECINELKVSLGISPIQDEIADLNNDGMEFDNRINDQEKRIKYLEDAISELLKE
ncbi:hypothetical protein V7O66_09875 [Methanolobus sp. ZRKC3]|uniref:hypothetical protein n=1 Tax=Methanolobus sp. ZRKC3 TaxID=3125786 RepID=UPI0032436B2E